MEGITVMRTQLLDPIPVLGVFLLFAIITLVFYEIGFRVGRWWQDRLPGEQEGPTDMLVGSLLALMAFLLAITMGMAADRFDARRGLVLEEANAIQAVYLQAGYLPPAQTDQMRELVREYATLRIATGDQARVLENAAISVSLHADMWAIVEEVVQTGYNPDVMSSFGDSLTDLITLHERRIVAGMYSRVPQTVLMLLLAGSALSLGHGRLQRRPRGPAERAERRRDGRRAGRRAGPRDRPRPAAGRVPDRQPAAAHRRPAGDRRTRRPDAARRSARRGRRLGPPGMGHWDRGIGARARRRGPPDPADPSARGARFRHREHADEATSPASVRHTYVVPPSASHQSG